MADGRWRMAVRERTIDKRQGRRDRNWKAIIVGAGKQVRDDKSWYNPDNGVSFFSDEGGVTSTITNLFSFLPNPLVMALRTCSKRLPCADSLLRFVFSSL